MFNLITFALLSRFGFVKLVTVFFIVGWAIIFYVGIIYLGGGSSNLMGLYKINLSVFILNYDLWSESSDSKYNFLIGVMGRWDGLGFGSSTYKGGRLEITRSTLEILLALFDFDNFYYTVS